MIRFGVADEREKDDASNVLSTDTRRMFEEMNLMREEIATLKEDNEVIETTLNAIKKEKEAAEHADTFLLLQQARSDGCTEALPLPSFNMMLDFSCPPPTCPINQ